MPDSIMGTTEAPHQPRDAVQFSKQAPQHSLSSCRVLTLSSARRSRISVFDWLALALQHQYVENALVPESAKHLPPDSYPLPAHCRPHCHRRPQFLPHVLVLLWHTLSCIPNSTTLMAPKVEAPTNRPSRLSPHAAARQPTRSYPTNHFNAQILP